MKEQQRWSLFFRRFVFAVIWKRHAGTASRQPNGAAVAWLLVLACAAGATSAAQAQDDSNFDIAGLQMLRGTVSRVSGDNVFVKLREGAVYEVETGANTHFVKDGSAATENAARVGDTVLAGGELDEKKHSLGAVFLAVVDAQELQELDQRRTQWGKTWLAGTVESKQGTKLVVKRPDGVVDTLIVDEDTSFRRNHESVTLPDVQVGDGMTATGAMRGGVFVARVFTVVDAAEIRAWSRVKGQ